MLINLINTNNNKLFNNSRVNLASCRDVCEFQCFAQRQQKACEIQKDVTIVCENRSSVKVVYNSCEFQRYHKKRAKHNTARTKLWERRETVQKQGNNLEQIESVRNAANESQPCEKQHTSLKCAKISVLLRDLWKTRNACENQHSKSDELKACDFQ